MREREKCTTKRTLLDRAVDLDATAIVHSCIFSISFKDGELISPRGHRPAPVGGSRDVEGNAKSHAFLLSDLLPIPARELVRYVHDLRDVVWSFALGVAKLLRTGGVSIGHREGVRVSAVVRNEPELCAEMV